MLYRAMITEDDVMIIETSRGVFSLALDDLSHIPGYLKTKKTNKLRDFSLDYDAILWNDDFDLSENGIFKYGRKLDV